MADDHLEQRAHADAIVERAADQLRAVLKGLVHEIDPFPPFPGSMFTHAIEVPPTAHSTLGCVIVADDAELYELQLGLDQDVIASGGDAHAARIEETVQLELSQAEYVTQAHAAIRALVTHLDGDS
ncbi:MAG: hypothetical protein O3A10_16935 [Chloroflexi bacterium]|nr:hypothetical protein [Chloroflexota bacterium]MDA1148336.1 hypothetical protein [Chloroflexota bacterium]